MIDKRLTFLIQGREALPVRAIPYVTGWHRFAPTRLVQFLAQAAGLLTAYVIRDGKPVAVPVDDWDAAWLEHAAEKLPAGVFVWSDEFRQIMGGTAHALPAGFEAKWQEAFGESYSDTYEKPWQDDLDYAEQGWARPTPHDDEALILDPLLMDDATRAMVMEGFDVQVIKPSTTAPAGHAGDAEPRNRAPRKTWRDVAWAYVVQVFANGKYTTAKDLYRQLEQTIGTPGSPFDKGTGSHRDSLIVRDISKSVSLKTIQNCWTEIKSTSK